MECVVAGLLAGIVPWGIFVSIGLVLGIIICSFMA